jgi:hypothetical protein
MVKVLATLAALSLACLMASPALAERSRKVKVIYAPGMGIHDAAQVIVPPFRPDPAPPAPTTVVNVSNNVAVSVVVRPRLVWSPWANVNRALFQNYPCFCRLYSGPRYPF